MVYFISGLGADERVFQFLDLSRIDHKFIQWIEPQKKENLNIYCEKLIAQIDTTQEVVLIGLSFGGIVAQEISKIIPCKKVLIISSIKSIQEFSWQLNLVRQTQIHRIVPHWLLALSNKFTADFYFSTENPAESRLLHQIIKDTDPKFLSWAIHQIMNWKNEVYPENLIHIHGTNDRIFPINKISNVIQIQKSGHFMIVNRFQQIQDLIFEMIIND
ncbi:alpha/beta hydrolase [Pedobacter sp. Hv1]|uniref:alpha/beta hydrolase n=1 Tax=Pedobacter sp. Hv1 TaxID=1740090 RepID=UPI0006D894D5|nr:alpha/beta hydrolase [Pedobacter sp. Hv1]KQB99291.1 hypothetical protein AQF98_17095 [Pedobacter sp. Hv1]